MEDEEADVGQNAGSTTAGGDLPRGKHYKPCELLWLCRAWVTSTENANVAYKGIKKARMKELWMQDLERVYNLLRTEGERKFQMRGFTSADVEDSGVKEEETNAAIEIMRQNTKLNEKWDGLVQHSSFPFRKGVALNQRWVRFVRKATMRFYAICEVEAPRTPEENEDQYFDRINNVYTTKFDEGYAEYRICYEYLMDKRVFLKQYERQRPRFLAQAKGVPYIEGAPVKPFAFTVLGQKRTTPDPRLRDITEYITTKRRKVNESEAVDDEFYPRAAEGADVVSDALQTIIKGAARASGRSPSKRALNGAFAGLDGLADVAKEALLVWQDQQDALEIQRIANPDLRKQAEEERAKLVIARMTQTRLRLEADLASAGVAVPSGNKGLPQARDPNERTAML